MQEFPDKTIEAVFAAYPPAVRQRLLNLRALILETAAETEGVGAVQEALKWGQPSYLTPHTKSGTTIRIDRVKGEEGRYGLFVHCQTNLVETFRTHYPDLFTYEGNRALVFEEGDEVPREALRHCIALALTYHLRKAKS